MASIRTDKQFGSFLGSNSAQVSQSGFTSEEYKLTKGKPDKDPRINPLPPETKVYSKYAFYDHRRTSDSQRLAEPAKMGQANAEEQVRLTLFFVRSALKRQKGKINQYLRKTLNERRAQLGERAKQMDASFGRLDSMVETLDFYGEMAEMVHSRVLSKQKG